MKALITGASSGLGRDMAKYLSHLGWDLIIVARREERLKELQKTLKTDVKIINLDLGVEENCYKLYEMTKKDNIDLLINNAGFGLFGLTTETSLDRELEMINLNIKAVHILTKLFLQDFYQKDQGQILNVASSAGFLAGPRLNTYYATKNYVVSLSLAIYEELKKDNSNVKISIFCPGPVDTNFNNVANVKFNLKSLSSEYASKYAIDNMFKDKVIILPPNMKLNHTLTKICPTDLILFVNSKIQGRKIGKK